MPSTELRALLQTAMGPELISTESEWVFKVVEHLSPTKSRNTSEAKRVLLQNLCIVVPHAVLWLDADDRDVLDKSNASLEFTTLPSGAIWALVPARHLLLMLPSLTRGAWAMFLAERATLTESGPPVLSFDPGEVLVLTKQVGAQVGIVSWHDDVEWLIAVAP